MDTTKIGELICTLRKEKGLTQVQLAERLNVSDKAVSKWERGLGCPDVSLLARLSQVFAVDLEKLLAGELDPNSQAAGNLKNLHFYVCPTCGNLVTALVDTPVSCCGKKLTALTAQKAGPEEKLSVEIIENDYFISSDHEMSKDHYISFVAFLTGDTVLLRKQYPEWNLQTRLPVFAHGRLLWYCTRHGLFYQNV
ncbi:MAG: helix-turn-helix domain-containing protein [Clostridiales bacterium]|uniref:helix-turn-helix domain-containing protein n=1 Tax=Evtepia sp. TaxID=2773933 RepID=UPI0029854BB8|nr:helix-turn-helix domain-containing protein [Evtepia sp.]MDD7289592.1 helix-turn-helix domain-containing protein [Clostridiales bacterium]MDY3992860.1 helix-turn-helix domain-containing protein [Evtepia sp.]MDY4431365.1 helix-turn-helix domain-containing protein [Evtepia sp.]